MDESVSERKFMDNAKDVAFFIVPYSLSLGILYLWGYWGEFGVNILQFAGVSDVVASAIFPFLIGGLGLSTGMILAELYSEYTGAAARKILPPPEKITPFLKENSGPLFRVYIAAGLMLAFSPWDTKWVIVPLMITLPISTYLRLTLELRIPYLPSKMQATGFFLVVVCIPWSYVLGRNNAHAILSGDAFYYIVPKSVGEDAKKIQAEKAMRFVGHVGDFDFFYDPSNSSTSIAKVQDDNVLTFMKHAKHRKTFGELFTDLLQKTREFFAEKSSATG